MLMEAHASDLQWVPSICFFVTICITRIINHEKKEMSHRKK